MTIDWDFELEKAHGVADAKSTTTIIDLHDGQSHLQGFTYKGADGEPQNFYLPAEWYETGFIRIIVDGLPIELTELPGHRVELHFPVGLHEHAKKDE